MLMSDKTDFKRKAIERNKEGHYLMIKETIQQEYITLVNIYAPNTGAPKYVKQIFMDINGQIKRNTVIVGHFNTLLTSMDSSFRQKTNKTATLSNTPHQMDLIDIFRISPQSRRIYILFKCT